MNPIFIGGCPRSGTSLMRAIIGSHPDVAIFQWDLLLYTYFYDKFKNVDLTNVSNIHQLINDIFSTAQLKICDIALDKQVVLERIAGEKHLTTGTIFRLFLEEYAKQVGRPRWGLKTPGNEFFADAIFADFPNAKMIYMVRDPRDVTTSIPFGRSRPFSHSLGIIRRWRKSVEQSQRNEHLHSGSYITVRYEDLVTDTESIVRQVCEVVQLPFDSEMLTMSGHIGWRGNNSSFEDIGRDVKKISTSGIGRHRTVLGKSNIIMYQRMLKKELLRFDYQLESFGSPLIQIKLTLTGTIALAWERLRSSILHLFIYPLKRRYKRIGGYLLTQPTEYTASDSRYARLNENERAFLEDVVSHPVCRISEIPGRLGLNVDSFEKIKNSLLSSNLLISADVSTAQGRIRYLQVSEKGKELLDINPLSN